MKALVIEKPGTALVKELPVPEAGDGEVLVRVMHSGICGTDIHIFRGEYFGEYPVVPGHEFSGVVEQVGKSVKRFSPGDRVAIEPNVACDNCSACLNNRQNFCENWNGIGVTLPGGMAEYACVPEKAVFPIGSIPFEHGAFVEPLACVIHGVERARIRGGDRVLIAGAGPIGLLLAQVIRLHGASCIAQADVNADRLHLAQECGADAAYASLQEAPAEAFDVVVDATGVIPVMEQCLKHVRKGGTVLLFGVPPKEGQLTLPAFTLFQHGLTVLSTFTSVRNSLQAVRLLESGSVDVSSLVSHILPLEGFEDGVKLIESGTDGVKKVLIKPKE